MASWYDGSEIPAENAELIDGSAEETSGGTIDVAPPFPFSELQLLYEFSATNETYRNLAATENSGVNNPFEVAVPVIEDVTAEGGTDPSDVILQELQLHYDSLATNETYQDQVETKNLGVNNTFDVVVPVIEDVTADSVTDSSDVILHDMLKSPFARLYSSENYTGGFVDYHYETATYQSGCHNLTSLRGNVKSMDTFEKCVRLFKGRNCEGWSQAVYPGSGNSHKVLNSKLRQVISVGPCLPDEFQSATISKSSNVIQVVKNYMDWRNTVPDLVEFLSHDKYWQSDHNNNSLVAYSPKGHLQRSEFLLAHIYKKHLGGSQSFNMEHTGFYKSLDKEAGDVIGYGIPLSLMGPPKENNIFPQTPSGKEQWLQLTSGIRPFLENNTGFVDLGLNFMYANDVTTRPYAFYYWMKFGSTRILYGRVLN
ncbi:unnamed protein product [Allacma fusca]|uniref:Uncharacterized protein n=1 Tax=Allacma fusca TaxID=39272 RepID=A0A8J2LNV1_9HEXA|nr:unnamed protein product [Allacma fusca]